MKRGLQAVRTTVVTLVVLFLALYGVTQVIRYPDPVSAVRLGLAPASKTPTLMPWHTVAPASTPSVIPRGEERMPDTVTYDGVEIQFEQFLERTATNAFLVMRDGQLTWSWYKDGFDESTQFPSYSVAKTMTSILIGQLIDQGRISENDLFIDHFPEYRNGTAFDRVTIRSLLDMQGGVGVSDDYPTGPPGWGVAIAQMYATTDLHWFLSNNRRMAFEPGSRAEYRSVDTQMLGMVIRKVTGERVADVFSRNVWQPVGAQYPATWNVDRVGGQEKTFCCFNASAIDYARMGQLLLDGGVANGRTIISPEWMKRLTTPVVTLDYDWGYGAQVWHPYPGILLALGLHEQYIGVDPSTRTVIVKVSDVPTGEDLTVPIADVLRQISTRS